ncbi:MAG: hypothetical protein RL497_2065 [Pseudomonadota bacterium]
MTKKSKSKENVLAAPVKELLEKLQIEYAKSFRLEDWFDIANYPRELTLLEWSEEILLRVLHFKDPNTVIGNYFTQNDNVREEHKYRITCEQEIWGEQENSKQPIEILTGKHVKNTIAMIDGWPNYTWENYFDKIMCMAPNLSFTDKELIKAFKLYLKDRRKKFTQFEPLFKNIKYDIQKWQDFNLLALFDLLSWKDSFKDELKYGQIGKIIWPDNNDAEDGGIELAQKVRKGGRDLIKEVFSREVAKALYLAHIKEVKK